MVNALLQNGARIDYLSIAEADGKKYQKILSGEILRRISISDGYNIIVHTKM